MENARIQDRLHASRRVYNWTRRGDRRRRSLVAKYTQRASLRRAPGDPAQASHFARLVALLLLVASLSGPWPPSALAADPSAYGVAVTPRNFPDFTVEDVDEAFLVAKQIGDYAVFIYQWGRLDLQVPRLMVEKSRRAGLLPIIGLSPTTLGESRKELDLPADVRRRAASHISFANPVVREAFKRTAAELARLQVPYLCLATEINFLAMQRLDEYIHFARLYQETYALVKRIAPQTRIFVSFQWEWMRILDSRAPQRIADHRKLVDAFRPRLDVVGLTSYPAFFHDKPADLAPDYFTWLAHHVLPTDEILLMEVGWPTEGIGSEQEQRQFVRALPELLSGVNVSVVAWALLHDVGLEEFDANLSSVGLVTASGRPKPAFADFEKLHASSRP